jgi:hypothetical protein
MGDDDDDDVMMSDIMENGGKWRKIEGRRS